MKARRRKAGRPSRALTPEDLVAVAGPLFAARGPDGVSLREVAERAGIRKASLLYHFDSKASLYHAVVDHAVAALTSLIVEARLEDGDFGERLDRLGAAVCRALGTRPEVARILVYELVAEGPYLRAGGAARVQETLRLTASFLEAGMKAGAFRPTDPRQLALSIVGLHLLPFAAARASAGLLGQELSSRAQLAARTAAVLAQVRALCVGEAPGVPPRRPRAPGRPRASR